MCARGVTRTTRTSVTVREEARLTYEWKNIRTGEVIETDNTPPAPLSDWRRVYTLYFGRVAGAGDSPGGYVRHVPGKDSHGPR